MSDGESEAMAKPPEFLALSEVTMELFETLKEWFDVPAAVVLDLSAVDSERVVREMGEERSVGFLRKFYGWYLRGLDGAKELRVQMTQAPSVELAEAALLTAYPDAASLMTAAEAEMALLPDSADDRMLDLPISIYGGG